MENYPETRKEVKELFKSELDKADGDIGKAIKETDGIIDEVFVPEKGKPDEEGLAAIDAYSEAQIEAFRKDEEKKVEPETAKVREGEKTPYDIAAETPGTGEYKDPNEELVSVSGVGVVRKGDLGGAVRDYIDQIT